MGVVWPLSIGEFHSLAIALSLPKTGFCFADPAAALAVDSLKIVKDSRSAFLFKRCFESKCIHFLWWCCRAFKKIRIFCCSKTCKKVDKLLILDARLKEKWMWLGRLRDFWYVCCVAIIRILRLLAKMIRWNASQQVNGRASFERLATGAYGALVSCRWLP